MFLVFDNKPRHVHINGSVVGYTVSSLTNLSFFFSLLFFSPISEARTFLFSTHFNDCQAAQDHKFLTSECVQCMPWYHPVPWPRHVSKSLVCFQKFHCMCVAGGRTVTSGARRRRAHNRLQLPRQTDAAVAVLCTLFVH